MYLFNVVIVTVSYYNNCYILFLLFLVQICLIMCLLSIFTACQNTEMIISNVYLLNINSSYDYGWYQSYINIENDDYNPETSGLYKI